MYRSCYQGCSRDLHQEFLPCPQSQVVMPYNLKVIIRKSHQGKQDDRGKHRYDAPVRRDIKCRNDDPGDKEDKASHGRGTVLFLMRSRSVLTLRLSRLKLYQKRQEQFPAYHGKHK